MLIGCITGPDFQSAKRQLLEAEKFCQQVELREDLFHESMRDLPKSVLPRFSVKGISTYHNFDETPQDLERVLHSMPETSLYKISTYARCVTDSLRMLAFVKNHKNVAGMCMGEHGWITRILAPVAGSPLTFAALGKGAFPSQMQARDLVEIYNYHLLNPSTRIYGLIGNPVKQSPSHFLHNRYFRKEKLNAIYCKFHLEKWELPLFFRLAKKLSICGLSVTTPYKETIFPYIDSLELEAEAIGAINTLTFGDKIYGGNTDGKAALDAIEERGKALGKRCVILGAGGASLAISYEAKKRGAKVSVLSRRYGNLHLAKDYDILINTTPLESPIEGSRIEENTLVMDINFGREGSPWINTAKGKGCAVIFGEEMFALQAQGQFIRWGEIPRLSRSSSSV